MKEIGRLFNSKHTFVIRPNGRVFLYVPFVCVWVKWQFVFICSDMPWKCCANTTTTTGQLKQPTVWGRIEFCKLNFQGRLGNHVLN